MWEGQGWCGRSRASVRGVGLVWEEQGWCGRSRAGVRSIFIYLCNLKIMVCTQCIHQIYGQ